MDDELETGQGALVPPAPPASTPAPSIDVEAIAKALEPTLKSLVEKQWQSGKDSRIGKLTSKVDEFSAQLERLAELKKEGFSEPQALRMMKLEEAAANPSNGNPPVQSAPEKQAGSLPVTPDAETLITALELDANDAEVTEVIRRGGDISNALITLKAKRVQAAKAPPNPASIVSPGGGTAADTSLEGITAQLDSELKKPLAQRDMKLLRQLQEKQRDLLMR
jgi:hypothetical protein